MWNTKEKDICILVDFMTCFYLFADLRNSLEPRKKIPAENGLCNVDSSSKGETPDAHKVS